LVRRLKEDNMNKELYTNLSFGHEEHPPSSKFNSILSIVEETRKFVGPFSVSKLNATGTAWLPTASSIYLELTDDPWQIGGVTGGSTRRAFTVYYYDNTMTNTGEARWDNIYFTSGTVDGNAKWYALVASSNIQYGTVGSAAGEINLSGTATNISSFSCYRYSG